MMAKYYCQNCQKQIEEGKQIKFHKRNDSYSRYSYGSGSYYTYYLCPECFKKQQMESESRNKKWGKHVGWGLSIFLIVLAVCFIFFLLYQYRQDQKTDRIVRKLPKKNKTDK